VLVQNRIKCKACGEVIESKHRHDRVSCKCGGCFVDGGLDYLRRGGKFEDISIVEIFVVFASGIEKKRIEIGELHSIPKFFHLKEEAERYHEELLELQ
jgi:hypothetical protein